MCFRWGVMKRRMTVLEDEKGQDLVEYGLLLTLIAVVCIEAIRLFGPVVQQMYENTNSQLGS